MYVIYVMGMEKTSRGESFLECLIMQRMLHIANINMKGGV